MAMNPIQFQRGMSLPEFHRSFGSAAQCAEALRAARWPQGFCCPRCGSAEHCRLGRGELYQCSACRRQTSLVAGTLMANTKLPLPLWFLAIYLIGQAKTGLSVLALKRALGVSYPTAWLMHHKIAAAMACTSGSDTFFAIVSPSSTAGTFASIMPSVVPPTTASSSP